MTEVIMLRRRLDYVAFSGKLIDLARISAFERAVRRHRDFVQDPSATGASLPGRSAHLPRCQE